MSDSFGAEKVNYWKEKKIIILLGYRYQFPGIRLVPNQWYRSLALGDPITGEVVIPSWCVCVQQKARFINLGMQVLLIELYITDLLHSFIQICIHLHDHHYQMHDHYYYIYERLFVSNPKRFQKSHICTHLFSRIWLAYGNISHNTVMLSFWYQTQILTFSNITSAIAVHHHINVYVSLYPSNYL